MMIRRVWVLDVARVTDAESRRSQNNGPSPLRLAPVGDGPRVTRFSST
jgi:hypothetical protein